MVIISVIYMFKKIERNLNIFSRVQKNIKRHKSNTKRWKICFWDKNTIDRIFNRLDKSEKSGVFEDNNRNNAKYKEISGY